MTIRTAAVLWILSLAVAAHGASSSEVVVLCALHQLHEQAPYYPYSDLGKAIERLQPDVLAVELTPKDLQERTEQQNKREYQNSVYPLLRRHNWITIALEPEGPHRAELIGLLHQSEESLQQQSPQKDEAFDTYTDSLFKYLLSEWHTPADVNDSWTDHVFAVKHAFQDALYGPKEQQGWEGRNRYFLDQIAAATNQYPG